MIVDIFMTFKDRVDLFEQSFKSFVKNTPRDMYRLTVVCDDGFVPYFIEQHGYVDHIICHYENLGLGPSINHALTHIDSINEWNSSSPDQVDRDAVSEFVCYCQDDILYTDGWLQRLCKMFVLLENQHNLGFATGEECVEHKTKRDIGNGMLLKDWIRATQMFARRKYWMSMYPIPALDPETGRKRAKPNDGVGSSVDWWFIRDHANSVCKTGKTCLVIPGLVVHAGYNESTWLDRDLPESNVDIAKIEKEMKRIGRDANNLSSGVRVR